MAHQLRVWAVDNADEALQTRSEQSPARLAHPSFQASAVCASGSAVEPSGDGTIAQIGETALLRCSDEQVKIRRKKRPVCKLPGRKSYGCCVGGQLVGKGHSSNNVSETNNAGSGSVRSPCLIGLF